MAKSSNNQDGIKWFQMFDRDYFKQKEIFPCKQVTNIEYESIVQNTFSNLSHTEFIQANSIVILSDQVQTPSSLKLTSLEPVVVYTPLYKREDDAVETQNTIIRYGWERCIVIDGVWYALFADKTAIIFDNDLLPRRFEERGRFGVFVEMPSIVEEEYKVIGIEPYTFSGLINLRNISLPSTLQWIGHKAFYGNEMLEEVDLPESIRKIGYEAFGKCLNLRRVIVPSQVTEMGNHVFVESYRAMLLHRGLTLKGAESYNPENLPTVAGFQRWIHKDRVKYALCSSGEAIVVGHTLFDLTNLTIPSMFDHQGVRYTVTEIAPFAFEGSQYLMNIHLPNTLRKIHNVAFARSNLQELIIPDSVEYMGLHLCSGCLFLKNASLPGNCDIVPEGMFEQCMSLIDVTIPLNYRIIGSGAFLSCKRLVRISLPYMTMQIEDYAFHDTALSYVKMEGFIQFIGEQAFGGNELLTTMIILNQNVKLAKDCWMNTERLHVYLEGSEDSPAYQAVLETGLHPTQIHIKAASVTTIEGVEYLLLHKNAVFVSGYYAKGIYKTVKINLTIHGLPVTRILPRAFVNLTEMEHLEVSDSVIEIGEGFVEGCKNLQTISLPYYMKFWKEEGLIGLQNVTLIYREDETDPDVTKRIEDEIKDYLKGKKVINIPWFHQFLTDIRVIPVTLGKVYHMIRFHLETLPIEAVDDLVVEYVLDSNGPLAD